MRNIFSYDSTLMRFLTRLFDLAALGLIFTLCSLPIFTIGAAQTGLASAVRSMWDRNAENTPYRAFFKGFANGFGRITIIWLCCLSVIGCILYIIIGSVISETPMQTEFLFIFSVIAIIQMMFQIMCIFVHSRFDCRLIDLIKNSWLLVIANPLRTFLMAVLVWAPLIFAIVEHIVFMAFSPFFIVFYYSLVFTVCYFLVKKPFKRIVSSYFTNEE